MINGERIKQARELRGLTQSELAGMVAVKQPAIAQIEANRIGARDEVLQRISLGTGFPVEFFRKPSSTEFPLGSLMFRARSSITKREALQALQSARAVLEFVESMEPMVDKNVDFRLPRLTEDPDTSARITRSAFGLSPDLPIDNLIHALEMKGILVLRIPARLKKIDAFCAWVGQQNMRPVIIICGDTPGDRLRFSVAHELGHLVLHHSLIGDRKKAEIEAMRFAAEFLMPESAMRQEITSPVSILSLGQLKPRWKVAISALIRRAYDLSIINQRRYTYLNQQLSAMGMRKNEPARIPPERPRAVSKMAELVYGEPPDIKKIVSKLNFPAGLLRDMLEANAGAAQRFEDEKSSKDARGKIIDFARRTRIESSPDL